MFVFISRDFTYGSGRDFWEDELSDNNSIFTINIASSRLSAVGNVIEAKAKNERQCSTVKKTSLISVCTNGD